MHKRLQDKKAARQITTSADVFLLKVERYLSGLLVTLDSVLDKRWVRTFFDLFISIIRHRNRSFGLVLSELGAYVLSPQQAPAGTKRISNLLRSKKWNHGFIMEFLLGRAQKRADELSAAGERVLLLWDDSVVEKPESWYAQGLGSVTSSKGKRLTKIKSGYYTPPKARICVPVPKTIPSNRPMPLVICLHVFAEWPAHLMRLSHWNKLADEFGFLVVYPRGSGFPFRWCANRFNQPEEVQQDVRFISDLTDQLKKEYRIDEARIYANGLSNGGGMSLLLACRLSERIAAIGGVGGAYILPWTEYQPKRPVPAIIFHGTADPLVPFHARSSGRFNSLPDIPLWAKTLAEHNGCQTNLPEITVQEGVGDRFH